jgi:NitT/TauT family transport system substrate-binding protein
MKLGTFILILFSSTVILPPFESAGASSDSKTLKPIRVILNWKAEPEFGGFYESKIDGTYAKEGIAIDLIEGGAGSPVVQMVASGKADIGVAAADDVILAQERGMDIVGIFAVYQDSPLGVMAHESKGFKSFDELMNSESTLALQNGSTLSLYLKDKFPKASVKIVPYTGGISFFIKDPNFAQQCYIFAEPILAKRQGAKPQAFSAKEIGYNPYSTLVIARRKLIEENKELVIKFLNATAHGWREYLTDPKAANSVMNRLNPSMDPETFGLAAEAQKVLIQTSETKKRGLGRMSAERWAQTSTQLEKLKLIRKAKTPTDYFVDFPELGAKTNLK